jgi:hypothetical protein
MIEKKSKQYNSYFKKVEDEAEVIYEDLREDIVYRGSKINISYYEIEGSEGVEETLSPKSRWSFEYRVNWTKFAIKNINNGLSGMLLESIENDDDEIVFTALGKFINLISSKMINENDVKEPFIKRSLDQICGIYTNNTYILNMVEDIFVFFDYDHETEMYFPYFVFNIEVNKVNNNHV